MPFTHLRSIQGNTLILSRIQVDVRFPNLKMEPNDSAPSATPLVHRHHSSVQRPKRGRSDEN